MKYLLDTCICIFYINGKRPLVRANVEWRPASELAVCTISKGEMFAGSRRSNNPLRSRAKQDAFLRRFLTLPFDDAAAECYGEICATLKSQGKLIQPLDMQIAAIAKANHLIVVTNDTRDFGRIPNLLVEDWTKNSPS